MQVRAVLSFLLSWEKWNFLHIWTGSFKSRESKITFLHISDIFEHNETNKNKSFVVNSLLGPSSKQDLSRILIYFNVAQITKEYKLYSPLLSFWIIFKLLCYIYLFIFLNHDFDSKQIWEIEKIYVVRTCAFSKLIIYFMFSRVTA